MTVVTEGSDNFYNIVHQLLLNDLVDCKVFLEGRRRVDLNQPAFEIFINDDIITEKLKAVRILIDHIHCRNQGF